MDMARLLNKDRIQIGFIPTLIGCLGQPPTLAPNPFRKIPYANYGIHCTD